MQLEGARMEICGFPAQGLSNTCISSCRNHGRKTAAQKWKSDEIFRRSSSRESISEARPISINKLSNLLVEIKTTHKWNKMQVFLWLRIKFLKDSWNRDVWNQICELFVFLCWVSSSTMNFLKWQKYKIWHTWSIRIQCSKMAEKLKNYGDFLEARKP